MASPPRCARCWPPEKLGQHNGLPASIIVTTTLNDLEAAAGKGRTGGGGMLPMSDVIRLARHAHHYLAIFDQGTALALYHTTRLASPGQRMVLYAKDRGCTAPGCDVSGYNCQAHYCTPFAHCHTTDVNDLTFACGRHHPQAEQGWTTRKTPRATPNGSHQSAWITANREPTATTTQKNYLRTTKTKTTVTRELSRLLDSA
jgi:hypothetical protein